MIFNALKNGIFPLWSIEITWHLSYLAYLRLLLNLPDKLNVKRRDKYVPLSKHVLYMEKQKNRLYKNNKFKKSVPIWNNRFELPDWSYTVSGIQDYFAYIIKKQKTVRYYPLGSVYINKTENRITINIKTVYDLQLETPETMKLVGSTKNKIIRNKNGENVPRLEILK